MQAADILQERYQIKQKLVDNAGRKTWLATDIQSSPPSPVIVKLIAFNPQIQWNDLKLFEREAQVLKNINHPKIPQYRNYFSVDDVEGSGLRWFGLVQEYIPGDSLKQLLDKGFKEKDVYSIATQILRILIHLHELSPPVIHRDIKPSNLILGKDNQIYLVDFGAVQDKAKAEGATFTVVGTSGYAPPEQLWGKAVPTSDLYALGATLIHLLTEIAPAELPQNQMRIQFKERVTINPEFANWIEQLIQPAPERRFSTARQALIALQALIAFQDSQSRIRKNESVSRANTPDYCLALLCAILSGFLLIFFSINSLTFFLLNSGGVAKAKQAKTNTNIGAINRAQQAYYLEYQDFSTDLARLGVGIQIETTNYHYSIGKTKNAVFDYAVSHQKRLKSYVGAVFAVLATTLNPKAEKKEMLTVELACEALRPGTTQPAAPTLQRGKVTCPEGTIDLSRPKP